MFRFVLPILLLASSAIGQTKPMLGTPLDTSLSINQGLVGWWLMNEGVGDRIYDRSGNGFTGVFSGDTAWVGGRVGPALAFDGTGDYVLVGSGFWSGGGPVTVSFWAYTNSSVSNRLLGGSQDGSVLFGVYCPHKDNKLYWDYGNNSGNGRISISYSGYNDVWTHIALSSDGFGGATKKIYLNGVEVASSGPSDGPTGVINNFTIGGHNAASSVSGLMDDVRIYNRALSASEMQELYSNPYPRNQSILVKAAAAASSEPVITLPGKWGGKNNKSGGK